MAGRRNRIPELDGLRVLMIFVVSRYHIWQQSWLQPWIRIDFLGIDYSLDWLVRSGYIWVDGTVLLSVFLLFLPWAEAKRNRTPNPNIREFYWRRARRVIPGYWFVVLLHLFAVALPWNLYNHNAPLLVKDLVTHLTFTFTQFNDTYLMTNLGGGAWTLAILVQGYVLFPFIARCAQKRPAATMCSLALVCFAFRAWCLWGLTDYRMVVNQLINFLDVYALGILLATVFPGLREQCAKQEGKPKILRETAATLLFIACLWGLVRMLKIQSMTGDQLQKYQMMYRPVFALCFGGMILTAPFALLPLRKLLGNPVTRFLGVVSMNYYLVHQTVAVHLKRLNIPPAVSALPNQAGEQPWQTRYTWISFGASLVLAILITYLVEKPGGKLMDRFRTWRQTKTAPAVPEPSGD